ncbi:hypothetical protein [Hymenobacter nivis]|uniref:Uncharacterized protein n=1 Tax=Hymenobacter nivis TaxID=1850093 RepID=A0A502HD96_9BACT|nr:hypothetical protein [Hymenobacter nivis]TPG72004.1 hypothetical protein EAH73_01800 [Hymenobacter nivis]
MSRIRNYTSVVTPAVSQHAIELLLVEAGARTISKFYHEDTKRCEGFFFQLQVGPQLLSFKLPANAEAVYQDFVKRAYRLDTKKRAALRAQAERTAWRTLHEWCQIQLDMIALRMVEPLQVLLAFQFDQEQQQTLFQRLAAADFKYLN